MVYATLVVEDILQEAAVHRVLASEGIPVSIYRTIGLQGAGFIDTNVARLARASAHGRYIVIRDLDRHRCPPFVVCLAASLRRAFFSSSL